MPTKEHQCRRAGLSPYQSRIILNSKSVDIALARRLPDDEPGVAIN